MRLMMICLGSLMSWRIIQGLIIYLMIWEMNIQYRYYERRLEKVNKVDTKGNCDRTLELHSRQSYSRRDHLLDLPAEEVQGGDDVPPHAV